jgi:type IV pilus assembly protein PilY1
VTLTVSPTTSSTALHEDNTALTKAMLGNASMTDQERIDVLRFSRGLDINDDDADANLTEARQSLGDPLHSEPLLITYGGTDATPDITIYFGTNEGAIHAINAGSTDTDANGGKETFAFVPQELLPNLTVYKQNNQGYVNRPYGMDGLISSLIVDPDGDLKILNADNSIQTGNQALLYAGMRLGGRQYYSLDVTDRAAPKLNWIIRGVDGGTAADKYREMGFTWSRMTPAKIKLDGVVRQVVIFSGGYDLNQDNVTIAPVDNKGRAIYIADAFTGERLWWAGIDPDAVADNPDLVVSDMRYSVPATPKAIDLNGDGLVDRIYVADMGGQVFRFILDNGNTGAATLGSVRKIAQLGGDGTVEGARRFYASPDVALIRDGVTTPFLSVSLGSGYRGHPLNEAIRDRFYVLRDPDVAVGSDTGFFATDIGASPNLFDATDNAIASSDPDVAAAAQASLASSDGFFIDLAAPDGTLHGEKVLTESRTFNNSVIFATFEPGAKQAAATCQASLGLSRFYLFSIVDGRPVQNLTGDSDADRFKELAQGGLPPDPTILFPSIGGVLPKEALVCVGPECFQAGLTIQTDKTYWIKQR